MVACTCVYVAILTLPGKSPRGKNVDGLTACLKHADARHRELTLLSPLADQQDKADHAILVANTLHAVLGINVVFELDDLLRRLRQVGDVRQGNVVRHLRLDSQPRARVVVSAPYRRIDADGA